MKMKKINVTETIVADIQLHIVQNGSGGPVIFWGMYPHQGGEVEHFLEALMELVPEQNFLLVAFQVEDWNRDFSPWEALAVFGTEGFCSENDWQRAYNEINEFEKELKDWGAVIIKFWVQIDKDTQLARFQERQNNPEKQWKITDEDWRNREKWDEYEVAVNEMLQKTNTEYAPWHILESVDKKYARIKALKIVIEEIKKYV